LIVKNLTGQFVDLRPINASDAEITLSWRLSGRSRHLNAVSGDLESQLNWIANRPESDFDFIIILKNGLRVGMVSLTEIDMVNKNAVPGRFLIGDEAAVKGKPVAVEAMSLVYQLAFDQLNLVRLHGIIAEKNLKMIKWQVYLGMKVEGVLRSHLFQNGSFENAKVLGLLEEDYRKITIPRMKALMSV